ncbi:hypothetical protein EUTSA_v10015096mg [Eutrema salsugineum]|uniref:Uncharacterized protein n=1 Tax=Eutrema salsugineum TaxID=72664 RepID=V4LES2_EUTSA|nr:uncharacterized protein LOC18018276 [Eutrema salsugineum]ESQ42214.1 hypothetical protein EUTSA_v10015096mg [Eutrema salsugineum]
MSKGCLSYFNIICFRKKQNKKQQKPVKAEDVVEPVALKDDEEESPEKKMIITGTFGYIEPEYLSTNAFSQGKLEEGDSASPLKNDFNKVKTFDLRGGTKTKEK